MSDPGRPGPNRSDPEKGTETAARNLSSGDLLPEILTPPPGPRSRALAQRLGKTEAPAINTLYRGLPAPAWAEAVGSNVLDLDGNRFIDLTSGFGVATIGHRHPAVIAAIEGQSRRLIHGLGDVQPHRPRIDLAETLAVLVPVENPKIYFGVSGAEAVEIALKTALLASGRPGVLAFDPAYHGLTLGALAVTSRDHFRRSFDPHLHPAVHRLPFGCDTARVDALLARRTDVGCAILEPVVGREGVIFPPPGWLAEMAAICRRRSVLLIADEIFTGFGRTGLTFAVDLDGVRPDLLVCGKALGGGLPIAAVAGRAEVMEAWATPGEARHTSTFVAHPLACAASLAALSVMAKEGLVARAVSLGEVIRDRARRWPESFEVLKEVRGRGLLWGLELASPALAASLVSGLLARGILTLSGGASRRVVQVVPPLTIARAQLAFALGAVETTLDGLDAGLSGRA